MANRGWMVTASIVLAGCGDNQDDAGARRLLQEVRADDYRSWARAPGYKTRRSSNAPHSDAVDIYINPLVQATLEEGANVQSWPTGSVIVKDGFSGSSLDLIAIMEKRTDSWYWAEYDDDGDPDYSGKPEICIDCHASGSDSVRAFGLP